MIRHTLITADSFGNVELSLPDGEQIRFAGVELAEEFLAMLEGDEEDDECN